MKFNRVPLPNEYFVLSKVSTEVFETFLSALNGDTIEVTPENFRELTALCDEFGFKLRTPSYRIARLEAEVEGLKGVIRRLDDEIALLRRTD
jgi:hypothetical protein